MPKSLIQYRVFIGSPGGLEEERKLFRRTLEKCTELHAEPRGATFYPVGWEDTISGAGRPQELINEDLNECDYAVFVLHDRWGSPTGGGYSSGTEEEWTLAEKLYKETKIRNITLFFKQVAAAQLHDPGAQLSKVLAFKRQIEEGKKYLFKSFDSTDEFRELLEKQLAAWLRDHEGTKNVPSSDEDITVSPPMVMPQIGVAQTSPKFDYWIAEATGLVDAKIRNYSGSLFCAEKALAAASSEIEWAEAKNLVGTVQLYLKNPEEAVAAFTAIVERLSSACEPVERIWGGRALVNKGIALGQLGRLEEEIAVYDDVIARFGSATEPALRESVGRALVNKGVRLGELGRNEEAISVYDDVIARFGSVTEPALREQVARALANKTKK
jgi:tetratricopeptide (TPR) repeat protein